MLLKQETKSNSNFRLVEKNHTTLAGGLNHMPVCYIGKIL